MMYKYSLLVIFTLVFVSQHIKGDTPILINIAQVEETLYFYPAKGEKMLDSLINQSEADQLIKYQGHLDFLAGVLAYKKGESDSALVYLEQATIAFVKGGEKLFQAKTQLVLGWLAEKIGYWQQAKINYYKVLELVDVDNNREQGLAYLGIARCKYYLREKIGDELQKGTSLLNAMQKREYSLYAEFLSLVINNGNKATPFKLLKISEEYVNMGLPTKAASVFKVLATYYRKMGDWSLAHKYIDKALALDLTIYPSASILPSLMQMKGATYFNQRDYTNAQRYLEESLKLSEAYSQNFVKYYIYKTIYKIDTLHGDYQSGLIHFSKAVESNRVSEQKGEKQLARLMEISLNMTLLEEENVRLRSLRNSIILLAFCIMFMLVVGFIAMHYKYQLKNKQKLAHEKEKKQALHALLVNLAEKRLLNRDHKEVIQQVQAITETTVERDSSLFNNFEECYSESIKKIRVQYPDLTQSDAIYAMMFVLNLSNSIIAEIKNINPNSIRKTKLRIRNKLKLDQGCDLGEFFTATISSL